MKAMVLATVLVCCALGASGPLRAADYALTNVHVLPMTDEDPILMRNQTILVEGDRITAVGATDSLEVPAGTEVIDGAGQYLLPGLTEMHGHVPPMEPPDGVPERYLDDMLFMYLAGGVTTVRGMLGHPGHLELRAEVNQGARTGPTLYLAGPSFNGNTVTSRSQARQRVQEHAEAGWDLLKIHPGLGLPEFRVVAEEARRQGIDFAGHIPADVGIRHAMVLGIRTNDHLDGYMAELGGFEQPLAAEDLQKLVRMTRLHDVAVVPTMAVWNTIIGANDEDMLLGYPELQYMPPQIRENWRGYFENRHSMYYTGDTAGIHAENRRLLLQELHRAGVTILLGTDAPQVFSVPGKSIRRELPIMQSAGMSNYDIIYSGTAAVGDYFSDQDDFGRIRPGARADLLLVSGDPLETIDHLYQPAGVMVRGQWLSQSALAERKAEIAEAYAD